MEANRVVRLLKNRSYPTFQLYAVMASKKTAPGDGLRLGALMVMRWLAQRLGDNAPAELRELLEVDDYKNVPDERLCSLHLSCGFVIDIVSLPEQGIWCLQLIEPDLGSDPGAEKQSRAAVPGRIFETNIGLFVNGSQLECGFQTVVSDPEGTEQKADVYRLAVVRRLMLHPDFGLRQIAPLSHEGKNISTLEQMKSLLALWRDGANQLPCVIFTYAPETPERSTPVLKPVPTTLPLAKPKPAELFRSNGEVCLVQTVVRKWTIPYDGNGFARKTAALCRAYAIDEKLRERFGELIKILLKPGDIVVLEPKRFGGNARILPFKPSQVRKKETMDRLLGEMYTYPRGKAVAFGGVKFVSVAREALLLNSTQALQQSEGMSCEWEQKLAERDEQWRQVLAEKDEAIGALRDQLGRQKEYQAQRELELERAKRDAAKEVERWKVLAEHEKEGAAYLRRKLDRPSGHAGIAAWVERHFDGRLVLHPRATALLEEKSARTVDVGLICDALDFLATDYWSRRYEQIDTEEMNSRCAGKYGRPFEVTHVGRATIDYTPAQYKIKYFSGARGKPVESPLDFHLRVGNGAENLLRIYFLHDDEKKLIVVGSLPRHLRAVTIN